MISLITLISNPSTLSSKLFGTVPSTPLTIGITITLMVSSFLVLLQGRSICLSFRFLLFSHSGPPWQQNSLNNKFSSFLFFFFFFVDLHLVWYSSRDELIWSQRFLCVSFSWADSALCPYHLVILSNFNL